MKRIAFLLLAIATIAAVAAFASGAPGHADEEAALIDRVTIPDGDADGRLIAVSETGMKSPFIAGAWQVDNRLSDAQLTTDGTTDYGKRKIDLTLGFARVNGALRIDDEHPENSRIDLTMYPATSIVPSIDENGIFLSDWLTSRSAHHTLVGFHSKRIMRTPDGRLQATGELALTSVDRNVEAEISSSQSMSELHADPPPVVHRITREVTFLFELPIADASELKGGDVRASGSTTVSREYFPQIVRTAIRTYWPALVLEENCGVPIAHEIYGNAHCTGTFLEPHGFPEAPQAASDKELHGLQNFNAMVGEHLNILVHMRLLPSSSTPTHAQPMRSPRQTR